MTDVLHILLGAALVLAGVLGAALSDRIRLARAPLQREATPARERRQSEGNAARVPKPATESISPADAMVRDAEAALVRAGYSKDVAHAAVAGVPMTDRHELGNLIRCALRRTLKAA